MKKKIVVVLCASALIAGLTINAAEVEREVKQRAAQTSDATTHADAIKNAHALIELYERKIRVLLEHFSKDMASKNLSVVTRIKPSAFHNIMYQRLIVVILDNSKVDLREKFVAQLQLITSIKHPHNAPLTLSIELEEISVAKHYQSQGMGSTLFDFAKQIANELSIRMEWVALPLEINSARPETNPDYCPAYYVHKTGMLDRLVRLVHFYEHRGGIATNEKHPSGGTRMYYIPQALKDRLVRRARKLLKVYNNKIQPLIETLKKELAHNNYTATLTTALLADKTNWIQKYELIVSSNNINQVVKLTFAIPISADTITLNTITPRLIRSIDFLTLKVEPAYQSKGLGSLLFSLLKNISETCALEMTWNACPLDFDMAALQKSEKTLDEAVEIGREMKNRLVKFYTRCGGHHFKDNGHISAIMRYVPTTLAQRAGTAAADRAEGKVGEGV